MSSQNGFNFVEEDLTEAHWKVYEVMCFFDQGDGCYAGRQIIATLAKVHPSTVIRAQFMLENVGKIRRGENFVGSFKKPTIKWHTEKSEHLNGNTGK